METIVNISMVTYNRLHLTKQSIQSVLDNTKYPYILTVVDNNSTDGTQDYLKELHNRKLIKNLILLDKNIGVAKASNLGWQMEDSLYYMKFDNDMIVLKDNWLNDLITTIDNVKEIGVIGYSVEGKRYQMTKIGNYNFQINSSIGGACFLVPERIRVKMGYWCEDFKEYGEEDAEYCWRVRHFGFHSAYMDDMHTLVHKDDNIDSSYRTFKDNCRMENLKSFWKVAKDNYKFVECKTKLEDYKNFIYTGNL